MLSQLRGSPHNAVHSSSIYTHSKISNAIISLASLAAARRSATTGDVTLRWRTSTEALCLVILDLWFGEALLWAKFNES